MHGSIVFIVHDGKSEDLGVFKDHLEVQGCTVEEFEQTGVAGQVKDRLEEMMDKADYAVMVFTARDTGDTTPSGNVIHETGLAQGHLGWENVIILCQKGCKLPSNLNGTVHIEFEGGSIKSVLANLDKVLRGKEHH